MDRSAGLQIRGGAEIRREATKLRAQRSGITNEPMSITHRDINRTRRELRK